MRFGLFCGLLANDNTLSARFIGPLNLVKTHQWYLSFTIYGIFLNLIFYSTFWGGFRISQKGVRGPPPPENFEIQVPGNAISNILRLSHGVLRSCFFILFKLVFTY